jgi:hypothetical protein
MKRMTIRFDLELVLMIKYCIKELREQDGKIYYKNIFSSEKTVLMCLSSPKKIYKIDVREAREDEETPYVGWLSSEGDINFIFPHLTLLEICFPYGSEAEELSGKGKVIRVKIDES